MDIRRHLLTFAALAACLVSASGCGGGESSTQAQAQPLPTSNELRASPRTLDVGIEGPGLFVLHDSTSGQRSYSRYGRLDLDHEGRLIHADGRWVLGFGPGKGSELAPLPKAPLAQAARATTRIVFAGVLDYRRRGEGEAGAPFDPMRAATYASATSITIWTAEGLAKLVTLYMLPWERGETTISWMIRASIDGQVIDEGLELLFQPIGMPLPGTPKVMHIEAGQAGLRQPVDIDLSRVMLLSMAFHVDDLNQDGYGQGVLMDANVERDGQLTLRYDNGQGVPWGHVALARFTVADRLQPLGSSSWICGEECQPPSIGAPGSALLGNLVGGMLNVEYR